MMSRTFIEKSPANLKQHFGAIIALSNSEREALGFLTNAAYSDAIDQKRLQAMLVEDENGRVSLVGYILHGGVFPHARVQQVCVQPEWRKRKVASALMDALVSELERAGFSTIKAKVADDLPHAQSSYAQHGFETALSKPGGSTRGRTIVIRVRNLDTPHLFSASSAAINLGLPSFGAEPSFYTFDLNVLFDLVKNRGRHQAAFTSEPATPQTFAMRSMCDMANSGQSLLVIGEILGHSQPRTTLRYAHLSNEALHRAANAASAASGWTADAA